MRNNKDMAAVQEQITKAQKKLEAAQAKLKELQEQPKKWEPPTGGYFLTLGFTIERAAAARERAWAARLIKAFLVYHTKDNAKKASLELRKQALILSYVLNNGGELLGAGANQRYFKVKYNYSLGMYVIRITNYEGPTSMVFNRKGAELLRDALNEGVLVLPEE